MKQPRVMRNQDREQDIGELIEEYRPKLKAFIRKQVANKDDADDILQDVFYQLIKTVDEALNPIEHISAWLYKVARYIIINKGKKKKEVILPANNDKQSDKDVLKEFSEILLSKETSPSPEMEYLRSLVWTELEKALSELPIEQREIFELTELDAIPVKEIAKTTGVSVNTLLSRKHYAVLFLRKRLSSLYDDIINS
ncbi:MAG TPA: sigma-70 family RNA polymerase sigma factor [Ignavibacteriaceae bacterium]|nr:sigma-70 family RNA polymerase sigma factor [Ignavibacteriaceae bacterium]